MFLKLNKITAVDHRDDKDTAKNIFKGKEKRSYGKNPDSNY